MDIDFGDLSLSSLVEDIQALGQSQSDARAAERTAEQEQMALLEQTLKTNEQYASEQARLFSDTEVTLKEMQGTANRITEISDSPLLRAIEPVVGFFSPEYSRDKLHQHLQQQQTELAIKDSQGEMLRGKTQADLNKLQTETNKSKMRAAIARGDVAANADQIQAKATAINTAEQAKALAIKQADSIDTLNDPAWQKKHGLVPGDVRTEIELRKDRKYTEQQQVYSMRAMRHQDQQRMLESATREQLQDPKWLAANQIDPMRAERQKQANDTQTMTVNNLRIASRQAAAQDTLDNMERPDIKKIASGEMRHPMISRVQADEHLKALDDKDEARIAARALHKRQAQENQIANMNLFVSTAPADRLSEMLETSDNGIVTIVDPETKEILGKVPSGQIQQELVKRNQDMLQQSDLAAQGQRAQDGLDASAKTINRALGIAGVEGMSTKEQFDEIRKNKHLPNSVLPQLNDALRDVDTALDESQLPSVRNEARARADAIMQKATKEIIDNRTAHMNPARRAATVEFYNSPAGTVSREAGMDIALPSIAAGETTDTPGYNRAIQHWTNKLRSTDVRDGKLGNLDPQRQRDLLNSIITGKTRTTEDTLRLAGVDNTLKRVMGEEILADVGIETYATAAEKAGLPTLAARVRAHDVNLADENGAFSSANIMIAATEELQRRGADPSVFAQSIVESIKPTIDRVLSPSGPRPELKAALNAMVFDNEQHVMLRSALMRDYNEAQTKLDAFNREQLPSNLRRGIEMYSPIRTTADAARVRQQATPSSGPDAFEMFDNMFK